MVSSLGLPSTAPASTASSSGGGQSGMIEYVF
jgi:hypothetical protein